MGRQDNDPTTVNSSIALLQERFRQLEKVKERREGKELLKLLTCETQRSTSSLNNTTMQQPRFVVPNHRQSSTLHDSLSLGLNSSASKHGGDYNTMKSSSTPSSSSSSSTTTSSFWLQGASTSSSRNFDSTDVDTSLHL